MPFQIFAAPVLREVSGLSGNFKASRAGPAELGWHFLSPLASWLRGLARAQSEFSKASAMVRSSTSRCVCVGLGLEFYFNSLVVCYEARKYRRPSLLGVLIRDMFGTYHTACPSTCKGMLPPRTCTPRWLEHKSKSFAQRHMLCHTPGIMDGIPEPQTFVAHQAKPISEPQDRSKTALNLKCTGNAMQARRPPRLASKEQCWSPKPLRSWTPKPWAKT